MAPSSNQPLLQAMLPRGPPTLLQYFLNPRDTHRVLGPEVAYDLFCGEFSVPLLDRAYADSRSGQAIELPSYLLLCRAMPGRGPGGTPSLVSRHVTDLRVARSEALDYLSRSELRVLLEYCTHTGP